MTDNSPPLTPEEDAQPEPKADRRWLDEAEEALDRVTKALTAAWEATREARMSALDSAKLAAKQLGEAIDKGAETARTRLQKEEEEKAPTEPPPADATS